MPDALTTALVVFGLIGALYGAWRRIRPVARRMAAGLDALVGKEAVTDRAGREIEPAQPGLVHRTATLEQAVATLVDQETRIKHLEDARHAHGVRIKALEDARLERIVTQAASAQAWRAVAENAVTDVDAPTD